MKAKNLRVGNLVKTNELACNETKGSILKVAGVGLDVDFTNGTTQNYIGIEGIKLTHKLLKQFGFVKQQCFFYCEGVCIEDDFTLEGFGKVPLRYVHQLQNLFFALTGTELELKDKVSA